MFSIFRDHVFVILKNNDYKDWKDGKAYARFIEQKDYVNPYGNIKSSRFVFDIIRDINVAKRENYYNSRMFVEEIINTLKGWNYENKLLFTINERENHIRRINRYMEILNSDDPMSYFSSSEKFEHRWWMTYDDFWSVLTRSGSQTVFEHEDEMTGVHIIGKCYNI